MYRVSLLVVSMLAAVAASAQEKPARTPSSGVPWAENSLVSAAPYTPKVIYGTDDRIDIYQETDPFILSWAASTCGLFFSSDLQQRQDGSFDIDTSAYIRLGLPACSTEPFATQPTAAFCTGFLVGEDIIATAGHCYSSGDLGSVRFVFGFQMNSPTEAVTRVQADQVYRGVALLGRQLIGDFDYAVVRVDRAVTAPGARPMPIRRSGEAPVGTPLGVIGHPAGLPLKIAFGPTTAVRSTGTAGYFVANLDTFGGNSGSPVFNAQTGEIEGILVRGETDYRAVSGCFVSNVVSDAGGRGEDVSKSTSFMQFIPELAGSTGVLTWSEEAYLCSGSAALTLVDGDLAGQATVSLLVTSSSGDQETLTLAADGAIGRFEAEVVLTEAATAPNSGQLTIANGGSISATYADASDAQGNPTTAEATALIDCGIPTISNVQVSFVGSTQAAIAFDTSEPTVGAVLYGASCENLALQASGTLNTSHLLLLSNLTPGTSYYFAVQASDVAGNTVNDNFGGLCYQFETAERQDYATQQFLSGASVVTGNSFEFRVGEVGYVGCRRTINTLPTPPGGQALSLLDDGSAEILLTAGKRVSLYGVEYARVFVNANGNITFAAPSSTHAESFAEHFQVPRVSVFFDDLNPAAAGAVFAQQFDDRLVVSWVNVPQFQNSDNNTMQAELYFSGRIVLSYESLAANDGIIGLSAGGGIPQDIGLTVLLQYPECIGSETDLDGDGLPNDWEIRFGLDPNDAEGDNGAGGDYDDDGLTNLQELEEGTHPRRADSDRDGVADDDELLAGTDPTGAEEPHTADINGDWKIDLHELLRVVQLYNSDGYHCWWMSEDGYETGPGDIVCNPHHSDYAEQNWVLELPEVLRAIQIYNVRGYERDLASPDTFAPVAPAA